MKTFKVDLKKIKAGPGYPSIERMNDGPVAVIECPEEIPCNPCETICPNKAIMVGSPITNRPVLYGDRCNGCKRCIPVCPGLAIFVINNQFSDDKASIVIPYERIPLPEIGDTVQALNRDGENVCEAEIIRVQNLRSSDKTAIITFTIPKKYSEIIRNFKP